MLASLVLSPQFNSSPLADHRLCLDSGGWESSGLAMRTPYTYVLSTSSTVVLLVAASTAPFRQRSGR